MDINALRVFFSQPPVWFWIIVIAAAAFFITVRWIVYIKAGEHGWASIIPFYADYCLCRISGKPKLFIPQIIIMIAMIATSLGMVFWIATYIVSAIVRYTGYIFKGTSPADYDPLLSMLIGLLVFAIVLIALMIAYIVLIIIINHGLSVSFGHKAGFTVGLFFLPIVFWAILAFGKSRYIRQ